MLTSKELKEKFQALESVNISLLYVFLVPALRHGAQGQLRAVNVYGGGAVLKGVWPLMAELAFKHHSLLPGLTSIVWKLCSPV